MKYLILILIFQACGKKPVKAAIETIWQARSSNTLVFTGNMLNYTNVAKNCQTSGLYIFNGVYPNTNDLDWTIQKDNCFNSLEVETCFFAKNVTNEYGVFKCKNLGISEAFYRIK